MFIAYLLDLSLLIVRNIFIMLTKDYNLVSFFSFFFEFQTGLGQHEVSNFWPL